MKTAQKNSIEATHILAEIQKGRLRNTSPKRYRINQLAQYIY